MSAAEAWARLLAAHAIDAESPDAVAVGQALVAAAVPPLANGTALRAALEVFAEPAVTMEDGALRRAIAAIEAEPGEIARWVSAIVLVFAGARVAGHSAVDVVSALVDYNPQGGAP